MRIVPCDLAHLSAVLDDPPALSVRLGASVPADLIESEWRGAFRSAHADLLRAPEIFPWWTALFVHDGVVCGMGGFKGPPDADGVVEIGYTIAPSLRGRGLATLAAIELVRLALAEPRVRAVQAHTLAERNASTRVLEKAGFRFVAEVVVPAEHPEPIWRWRLDRVG